MVRRIDCRYGEQDIPCADDAIPKGSISLFDAFWRLLALMDGDRFEHALNAGGADSLVERRHIPDDARSDLELLSETKRRTSNFTLRWALETAELVACVRDPETGDVLQLASEGWVDWDDDIPARVTSNFIIPGEYDSIGPSGTFIRGALRPVFFVREEFETWLKEFFEDLSPAASSPSLPATISRRPKAHRLEATKEAIFAKWGHDGPPSGLSEDMREQKISEWLKANGRGPTSKATIRRALAILSSS
jgi:hypothetical protein